MRRTDADVQIFKVAGMTCGRCVRTVTDAIREVVPVV